MTQPLNRDRKPKIFGCIQRPALPNVFQQVRRFLRLPLHVIGRIDSLFSAAGDSTVKR